MAHEMLHVSFPYTYTSKKTLLDSRLFKLHHKFNFYYGNFIRRHKTKLVFNISKKKKDSNKIHAISFSKQNLYQ